MFACPNLQNFTYDFFFYKQAKVIRGGKIVAQDVQEQETHPLNHKENCPNKMYKKKPPPTLFFNGNPPNQ